MGSLRNYYPGKTISDLLPIRDLIMEARTGGSLTSVGIEPRISNQFKGLTQFELNQRLDQVDYALYLLAKAASCAGDPSLLAIYANPYCSKNRKIHTVYGWPLPYNVAPTIS
jgi:hypothetical protein